MRCAVNVDHLAGHPISCNATRSFVISVFFVVNLGLWDYSPAGAGALKNSTATASSLVRFIGGRLCQMRLP